jgi:hypothetical protein
MADILEIIMNRTVIALTSITMATSAAPAIASTTPVTMQSSTPIEISIDQSGRPIISGFRLQSFDERINLTKSSVVKNGLCGYHCRTTPGQNQA